VIALAPVGALTGIFLLIGLGSSRYRSDAQFLLRICTLGAAVPVVAMLLLLLVYGYPEGGGHRGPLALIGPVCLIYLGSFGALSIAIGAFKFWRSRHRPI